MRLRAWLTSISSSRGLRRRQHQIVPSRARLDPLGQKIELRARDRAAARPQLRIQSVGVVAICRRDRRLGNRRDRLRAEPELLRHPVQRLVQARGGPASIQGVQRLERILLGGRVGQRASPKRALGRRLGFAHLMPPGQPMQPLRIAAGDQQRVRHPLSQGPRVEARRLAVPLRAAETPARSGSRAATTPEIPPDPRPP